MRFLKNYRIIEKNANIQAKRTEVNIQEGIIENTSKNVREGSKQNALVA